ncbi:MAG TPA: phosphatidate cytidylyltransferase [Tepidisphaeraceae bacterium]|jgi:phosphatidate cytidylyltransferase
MERTLRNRLTFGPLMLMALGMILWVDFAAESWTRSLHPGGIKGIGVLVLLLITLPPATIELAMLFAAERVRPYRLIAASGSNLLCLHAWATQFTAFQNISTSVLAFVIVFVMIFAALRRAWVRQTQEAIVHMAGTVLATLYLGGLSWFLMALRVKTTDPMRQGHHWGGGTTMTVLTILLVVKSTDIGAFFGGRKFGKHKLIPWLSPGKTWEGLFFGVLTSALVAAACAGGIELFPWWKGLIFGAVIGAIGQAGDLLESLMKRDAEVKDSGRLIPGFGGILDVIDSPLFAAPFAYLLFSLF